jgi:hypothetical protein
MLGRRKQAVLLSSTTGAIMQRLDYYTDPKSMDCKPKGRISITDVIQIAEVRRRGGCVRGWVRGREFAFASGVGALTNHSCLFGPADE